MNLFVSLEIFDTLIQNSLTSTVYQNIIRIVDTGMLDVVILQETLDKHQSDFGIRHRFTFLILQQVLNLNFCKTFLY